MPSLKLPNPFRRGADRPSLKQRAANLKASAARVMGRKAPEQDADPFEGMRCPPGFVRYPFENPAALASIARIVIPNEARRLFEMARDEALRRLDLLPEDMSDAERTGRYRQIRDLLRMDALESLVGDQPKPCSEASADPAVAAEASANFDAELLALGAQWRAVDAAYGAALSRADEIEDAASIAPPPVLFVQPGDDDFGIASLANPYRGDEGSWYSIAAGPPCAHSPAWQSGALRKPMLRLVEITKPCSPKSPAIPIPRFEERPWPEAQARADEICSAYTKWKAEEEAARQAAGVPELEAETNALSTEAARLEDEISAATAMTVEGLKLQAAIALQCQHHADGDERAWAVVRALLKVA